jgi:hypothetical protein
MARGAGGRAAQKQGEPPLNPQVGLGARGMAVALQRAKCLRTHQPGAGAAPAQKRSFRAAISCC